MSPVDAIRRGYDRASVPNRHIYAIPIGNSIKRGFSPRALDGPLDSVGRGHKQALSLIGVNFTQAALRDSAVPKTRASSGLKGFDRLLPEAAEQAPLGELVDIMDVGFACAYLATPYARRITGGTIYVDGGANIRA